MYFDAVVVEVEKFFLFFQIGSGHTVQWAGVAFEVNDKVTIDLKGKFDS